MNNTTKALGVRILDKEYRVACAQGEENELLASARYLDQRMREIRGTGKVIGTERIAVMAALNLAHELLNVESLSGSTAESAGKRLQQLRERIEIALNESNQLEL